MSNLTVGKFDLTISV